MMGVSDDLIPNRACNSHIYHLNPIKFAQHIDEKLAYNYSKITIK